MNPYGKSTETSTEHCHCEERSDVAIQATEWHLRLVGHDFLTPNQLGTGLTTGGLPRSRWSLAMTCCAAFTMAARLSRSTESRAIKGLRAHGRRMAFTMAEILLSLTIIGVVAAITLPSLTGNINERTWNTQRKALYARMSQAIALMPSLNGYGTVTEGDSSTSAVDTAAETFVTAGLSKVLKINNICDSDHLEDCGIPTKFTTFAGSTISSFPKTIREFNPAFYASDIVDSNGNSYSYLSQLDTVAAAFETANGESIVAYYNPYCSAKMDEQSSYYTQPKMCANLVYDLNGTKGPNTVGKDMGFITILYPSDPVVVAPVLVYNSPTSVNYYDAAEICRERDSESRLSNLEEAISLSYNRALLGENIDGAYWTSAMIEKNGEIKVWRMYFAAAQVHPDPRHYGHQVMCVKR